MTTMNTLLESADVARALNLTPGAVRLLARAGRLRVAAVTPRGGRLFRAVDVEVLRQMREALRAGSQAIEEVGANR